MHTAASHVSAQSTNPASKGSASSPDTQSQSAWIFLTLLAVLVGIVFARACGNEFVTWDDHLNVSENPDLNPVTASSLSAIWLQPRNFLYVPLTYSVWAALTPIARTASPDADGATLNPFWYHGANVLVHWFAACMVFAIAHRIARHNWASFAGAALFAVHPLQVDSVAWVTGLKDTLSGALSLAAIWQYTLYADPGQRELAPASIARRQASYIFATIAFIGALLAKPSAACVPLVAGLIDVLLIRRRFVPMALAMLPWVSLAATDVLLNRSAQPVGMLDFIPPIWQRPIVALDAVGHYLIKMALPIDLCIDYGRTPPKILHSNVSSVTCVIAIAAVVAIVVTRRRLPALTTGAMIWIAALTPVLGFVPFEFQTFSTVADHYAYLAFLGPAIALAIILSHRPENARSYGVAAAIVLAALAGITIHQIGYWRDSTTLLNHTLAINPESWSAHQGLGIQAVRRGNFSNAEQEMRVALQSRSDKGGLHTILAIALMNQGKLGEAISEFRDGIRLAPADPEPHFGLARLYELQHQPEQAELEIAAARKLRGPILK